MILQTSCNGQLKWGESLIFFWKKSKGEDLDDYKHTRISHWWFNQTLCPSKQYNKAQTKSEEERRKSIWKFGNKKEILQIEKLNSIGCFTEIYTGVLYRCNVANTPSEGSEG